MTTKAEELHGRRINPIEDLNELNASFDSDTLIYTFSDGSRARVLTKMEDCEPYIAKTTSTMSKRPYYEWIEVK